MVLENSESHSTIWKKNLMDSCSWHDLLSVFVLLQNLVKTSNSYTNSTLCITHRPILISSAELCLHADYTWPALVLIVLSIHAQSLELISLQTAWMQSTDAYLTLHNRPWPVVAGVFKRIQMQIFKQASAYLCPHQNVCECMCIIDYSSPSVDAFE